MAKEKYNLKEKNLFWLALLLAIVSSILVNIWMFYLTKFSGESNLINFMGLIIFTAILMGTLFYIKNKIE